MASTHSTPLSARHAYPRQPSPFDDTPTRAPSSQHSSLNPLTSLKPQRSNPNLSHARKKMTSFSGFANSGAAGLRTTSVNTLDPAVNRPHSRLSKASDLPDDGLGDAIEADNTEMARRRIEASFQRQLDSLANAALSLSSASDHDDGDRSPRRGRFDDESASTRSSASRTSVDSIGSLRIGLTGAGARPARPRGVTIEDVPEGADDTDDDHLTYVTERSSVLHSPAKKVAAPSPSRAPAALAPSTGLFGSPRPSPFTSVRPTLGGNENQPPPSSAATFPRSSAPAQQAQQPRSAPAASSAYPTVPPPRTVPAPFSGLHRSPFSAARPAAQPQQQRHYSPLNPALNSPLNGSLASPSSSFSRSVDPAAFSRANLDYEEDDDDADGEDHEADRTARTTTRTALPDKTGLTDLLRSPTVAQKKAPLQSQNKRASPLGSGSAKSAEANLVSNALASLTAQLASLERENAASSARVAELEHRLREGAAGASSRSAQRERERERAERSELREEVEGLLQEERDRRAGKSTYLAFFELERVVSSLRAQNAHLDATLSAQHATLSSLRRAAPAATDAPAPAAAAAQRQQQYALRSEVQDLKHALAALGYEVDGVRTVVEELLRDKEQREAGRRWEAEEEERRRSLAGDDEEDQATPRPSRRQREREEVGAMDLPSTPQTEDETVEDYGGAELGRKAQRAHKAVPLSTTSYDETYVPSSASDSASLVSATSATTPSSLASSDVLPAADEPDFARAQRIFASVSPRRSTGPAGAAAARKTRKSTQQRGTDRVVLVDEPSANLCANCHGRKEGLKKHHAKARRSDGAEADEEDLAPGEEERERRRRARKAEKKVQVHEMEAKAEKERDERARVKREDKERRAREKKAREREEHRVTLEQVLDRLEDEFATQKKIYLELTAEYQSMTSRADTRKRRVLAEHLKQSIDVLEDKAREVKRYADALEDLYQTLHAQTCPRRKTHAIV